MPYPRNHRLTTRKQIVESARKQFNRYGFENVSIQDIMAGAGLTHGGFYSYFKSKSDLYSEVLNCFFTDPDWKNCWEGVRVDMSSADSGAQVVSAYLSRQHFENIENSCPMVALPTDVARSNARARQTFETVFKAMVNVLARGLTGTSASRRTRAQGIAAMCVGGMILARTMQDRAFADAIRKSCTAAAHTLGGWEKKKRSWQ
jgi:AcrR family transcriptional regulator